MSPPRRVNGVCLNVEVTREGPAVLLLHGFTGSAASWAPFMGAWHGFTLIAPDLLGHGASDHPADSGHYSMERCVEDLLALLDRLSVGRVAVVGYSMGGRVALHLALAAPERLWALVLESVSPGIDDPGERAARRESDEALAGAIEREGVEAFVARWESQPLFASQARLPPAVRDELRRQRLRNSAQGLANSLRGMGAAAQEPLWDRLREVQAPALLIAGALDAKYCALARRMAQGLPRARVEIVPDAGHAVHLEQPEAFAGAVRAFLVRCLGADKEEALKCR
ncbi:MAG: 2-succinyl-6-hydroxy-2,4-cyclohexadiene-1-carboxylate synthase [Dehalococcoidia bacterium]|nr:2-succinyl-6-hydroxy-2,4-cyclohexadiene-1-carboxylate synthase [Dehalococcoidia bacterium]